MRTATTKGHASPAPRAGGTTRRALISGIGGALSGGPLLMVTVLATACVPRPDGAGQVPGTLRRGVTLTLAHFYPPVQQDNIKRRVALFQQETPGIQVNEVALQGGAAYRDRLLTLFAGDTPPDVMHMSAAPGSGYSFGVFAPLGHFFELGPLARRDRYDLDDFYKVALDFNSFGGKLFVMPNDLNVFATYWSQELFRQAGVAPPPTDWRSPAFDQNALLEAARRLTDRNVAGSERYGLLVQPNINWTLPFLWSNGADVVSRDLRRITLDEPAALDTLQFLADAVLRHRVSPTNEELAAAGGANPLFFQGRLGMHHTGSNFVNQLRASARDLAFDVGVSPRGRVRRHSVAGGAGFAGAAASKNREEAWALLKHLGGKASLEIGALEGQMPTRRSVARSAAFIDPAQPPANRRVFLDAAENASPAPMISNWFEVEAVLNTAIGSVMNSRASVREAVSEAKRLGDPLLAAGQTFNRDGR